MGREYRIVRDNFSGFEVQHRSWWWPFWKQTPRSLNHTVNTFSSLERAEAFARLHAEGKAYTVKHLGKLGR